MSSLITLKGQLVKDVKYSLAEGNVVANLNRELVLFPLVVNSTVDNREHKSLYYVYFDKSCSALKNLKAGVTIEVEGIPFMRNLKDKCLMFVKGTGFKFFI
ncbi:MAG: hypothetical protein ACOYK1_09015 [Vampirovibrionia bacterium]